MGKVRESGNARVVRPSSLTAPGTPFAARDSHSIFIFLCSFRLEYQKKLVIGAGPAQCLDDYRRVFAQHLDQIGSQRADRCCFEQQFDLRPELLEYDRQTLRFQQPVKEINSPRSNGRVGAKGTNANDFDASNPAACAAPLSANGVSAAIACPISVQHNVRS